jgi:hypothetical protein
MLDTIGFGALLFGIFMLPYALAAVAFPLVCGAEYIANRLGRSIVPAA